MTNRTFHLFLVAMFFVLFSLGGSAAAESGLWRDPSHRVSLRNDAMEAHFQAGMLYSLEDRATGKTLLKSDPGKLPSQLLVFDATPTDLDSCTVVTESSDDSVQSTYRLLDGSELRLRWSIEKDRGDLILQASAHTAKPVEQMRYILFGCDIADHALVWINAYGVGQVMRDPWQGTQIGDPQKDGVPNGYAHPLVALFQGDTSGWFLEGRDPRIGPSSVMVRSLGRTAHVGMARRFPIPTPNPELFEIRIRTYQNHWEDAVDPFTQAAQCAGMDPRCRNAGLCQRRRLSRLGRPCQVGRPRENPGGQTGGAPVLQL